MPFEKHQENTIKKTSTIGRIVAVIVCLLLIVLLSGLCYQSWITMGKKDQAEANLVEANKKIKTLNEELAGMRVEKSTIKSQNDDQVTKYKTVLKEDDDKIAAFALQAAACVKIRKQLHL